VVAGLVVKFRELDPVAQKLTLIIAATPLEHGNERTIPLVQKTVAMVKKAREGQ